MKRIDRVAKGEKVVVPMIQEDLQEIWNQLEEVSDDAKRAQEELLEESNDENAKKAFLLDNKHRRKYMEFWEAIHDRYGHWNKSLGLRDNYALVICSSKHGGKRSFGKFIMGMMNSFEAPDAGNDKGGGKGPTIFPTPGEGFEVED